MAFTHNAEHVVLFSNGTQEPQAFDSLEAALSAAEAWVALDDGHRPAFVVPVTVVRYVAE